MAWQVATLMPCDRASSLTGQILDGRYQVVKKLGEGGMSYVYLARETATNDTVATTSDVMQQPDQPLDRVDLLHPRSKAKG